MILITLGVRLFDTYKKVIKGAQEKVGKELYEETSNIIKKYQQDLKDKLKTKQELITKEIQSHWRGDLQAVLTHLRHEKQIKSENYMFNFKNKVKALVLAYKTKYTELHEWLVAYFNNIEGNFSEVQEVASLIKEDSIQPSFNLLQDTLADMSKVRSEIEKIKTLETLE